MKKLIIAALLLVGMTSFAQQGNKTDKKQGRAEMEKFTPEQRNELMLKKMTLELDLSSKQQAQMKSIIAEKSAKSEAMMKAHKDNKTKPTRDERFAMKTKMMDEQIAMKAKMKSILSDEQFVKWDAMKEKHDKRRGHRMPRVFFCSKKF
jgi:Tfp pilus assembly protein PilE